MLKLCIKVNASIQISSFRRSCYTDLTEDVPINILGQSFCADLVTMIYVATRLEFCISKHSILIKFIKIAVLHEVRTNSVGYCSLPPRTHHN